MNKNKTSSDKKKIPFSIDDKFEDIKWNIRHSSIGNRLHDRRWSIQESIENDLKGYCDADVVNLGDRLVEHYAELLDYLARQSYGDVDQTWLDHLRPISESFSGYNNIMDELDDIGRFSTIGEDSDGIEKYRPALVGETYNVIKSRFLEDWKWVGENVLTEKFNMPLYHDVVEQVPTFKVQSYYSSIADNLKKTGKRIATAAKRHSSKNSFHKSDISQMPSWELIRTRDLLYEMAHSTIGSPVDYHNSEYEIAKPDGWEEHQSLAASLFGNPSVVKESINKKTSEGTVSPAKNEENADYAAWIEDLTYAADVISTWNDWIKPNGLKEDMSRAGALAEQVDQFDKKLHDEFIKIWMWIGRNVGTLWI